MNPDLETLYENLSAQLRRFILRRVSDSQAAEDILQEVFLRIHEHLHTLRDETRLTSWIYQIARHAIIDHYRREKAWVALPDGLSEPPDGQASTWPTHRGELEEQVAEGELAPFLRQMIARLPAKYRRPLVLSELRGFSHREIAAMLGLSVSGVKSRVQRARQQLKALLLDCCRFEFDRWGNLYDCQPRRTCPPPSRAASASACLSASFLEGARLLK